MWLQPLCPTGTVITSMSRRTGLEAGNYKSQKNQIDLQAWRRCSHTCYNNFWRGGNKCSQVNLIFWCICPNIWQMIFVQGEYLTNDIFPRWIIDKWYLPKVNTWQMIFPRWTATLQTQTRLPALSAILFGPFAGAFFFLQYHTISLRNITLTNTTSTKLPAIYVTIQGVQDQPGRQRSRNTGNPDRWCLFNTQCTKHGIQCTV